jgi:uncharacterized membrane protein YraQ (UPF0718 family)
VNRRHQPFFFLVLLLAAGALANPSSPHVAPAFETCYRILFNAASIVLAAAPFVMLGAIGASVVSRVRLRGTVALLATALTPGCDCSMNGFAGALSRSPAPLAGAALAWGAACNPVALATTTVVLGAHLAMARAAGGAVAALALWFLWRNARDGKSAETKDADDHEPATNLHARCGSQDTVAAHLERGLRALLPAALLGALLPLFFGALGPRTSPPLAALIGAALSPCSSADPVLARLLTSEASGEAAFMIASQCLDVRQLALILRVFGPYRALLAALAGGVGCLCAAVAAH